MFYSFTVSAGIPCSIDRDWEKRKDAVCVGAAVAKQVSMDLSGEPAPARSYILQTGDESAHGFGSCGYCCLSGLFSDRKMSLYQMGYAEKT